MLKELTFEPLPIQYKVWNMLFDNETTQILFGGAARVSKSYLLVAWATIYCLMYPNIAGGLCRETLSSLKMTTVETLMEFFRLNDMKEDVDYRFNRMEKTISFNNGSKLFLIELTSNPSDPNFERIMSLSLTFAIVDEVSQISRDAIEKLMTRLSHMLKEYQLIPKLLLVSNPSKGWLYTDYYKPYTENELPLYRKIVLALPQDNPYLDKSYIDGLEQTLTSVNKSRLLYGNWDYDDDDLALFSYDELLQSFYNDPLPGDKYITCDVANIGNDKSVIGLWSGTELLKIFSYKKNDTTQLVNIIKDKIKLYRVPIKNVLIDADGLGIGVADYLKGCVAFKGGSSALNKENYMNLRSQCFFKLSESINNIKLPDGEYRDVIIQELQAHRMANVDKIGKTAVEGKDKVKKTIGRSPDYADMIMMRMYYDIQRKKVKTYVL